MRIGTTLPQFQPDAERALAVARAADAGGLDGVFVFDHLWPMGRPDGDFLAMLPLLSAVAADTTRVKLGPLVARVGLVPDAVLVHQLATVDLIADRRLIAALGTGDRLSADENRAFGVDYPSAGERLATLERCASLVGARDIEVWVGGTSDEVRDIAVRGGWALNLWGASPAEVAARLTEGVGEVTWGGQVLIGRDEVEIDTKRERLGLRPGLVHGTVAEVSSHLRSLGDAGASWAVCAPLDVGQPGSIETLTLVAEALR